jgi:hypothetical protein
MLINYWQQRPDWYAQELMWWRQLLELLGEDSCYLVDLDCYRKSWQFVAEELKPMLLSILLMKRGAE